MRVTHELRVLEPAQGQSRSLQRECAVETETPQGVQYFDLEDVWYV